MKGKLLGLGLGVLLLSGCATPHLTAHQAHAKHITETRWEGEPDDAPIWSSDPKKMTIVGEISTKVRALLK